MKDENVIPASCGPWRHGIEVRCGIPLTPKDISARLSELQNDDLARTNESAKRCGTDHLQRAIAWFQQAGDEVSKETGGRRHA